MQHFDARVTELIQATPSIRVVRLTIADPAFRYLPGQWIDLGVDIDGERRSAGFSITTSPVHDGAIELAIKVSNRHPVARWIHDRAVVGDVVNVSQGQGPFVFLPEMSENLVLIGGGVGVTPLLSIFRHVRDAGLATECHLLYSVSQHDEILFRDELDAAAHAHANLHVTYTVTQQDQDWRGLTGRVDPVKLHALGTPDDTLYYLCGPKGMVEDMSTMLHDLGVPMNRIIFEKWW